MMKNIFMPSVLIGLMTLQAPAQLQRGEEGSPEFRPEQFAQRCVHRITRVAMITSRHMHHRTNRCVRTISALLEGENVEQAREVATRCQESIAKAAERRGTMISRVVERCVEALTTHEAPEELIVSVQSAGEDALAAIQEQLTAEMVRVTEALGDAE